MAVCAVGVKPFSILHARADILDSGPKRRAYQSKPANGMGLTGYLTWRIMSNSNKSGRKHSQNPLHVIARGYSWLGRGDGNTKQYGVFKECPLAGGNDLAIMRRISTGTLPRGPDEVLGAVLGVVEKWSTGTGDPFLADRRGLLVCKRRFLAGGRGSSAGDGDLVTGRAGFVAPAVSLPDRVVTIAASGGGKGERTGRL